MLYISTSVWVLRTPIAGRNMPFNSVLCKKLKKEEKSRNVLQNLAKNYCICCDVTTPSYFAGKGDELGIKKTQAYTTLDFWCVRTSYFDQHLECAVPKHWSKYTTPVNVSILLTSSYQKYLEIREIVKMDLKLKPVDISMLWRPI